MGHSVHSIDICQVQLKLGLSREEHTFPVCPWTSKVCAEIIWLWKSTVSLAVWVAGLRRSHRWRSQMWRSWAGVVTRGLRLGGQLDVLPISLKQSLVEKLTLNYLATALVDILSVSMPIAHSLKTSVALCCDKTTHFRVSFYCPQHKVDLCNDHAV
jgi:hypothetical protein